MPNPNLTRHLLSELSVGTQYDEQDLAEAARAFTGWFVLQGRLKFFEREHDPGTKTVLDQKGNWEAKDIVRILLDRSQSAEFLVRDVWRWLISEVDQPDSALIEPLVGKFAESYDIGWLVKRCCVPTSFFRRWRIGGESKAQSNMRLGIVRGIGRMAPTLPLAADLAALGQTLYNPPTTKGWAGGQHWLNAATVVGRERLARHWCRTRGDTPEN